MSIKKLSLIVAVVACAFAVAGSLHESPRERASALLVEQAAALETLYARDASPAEVAAVVATFDERAAPVLAELDADERASFENEVEHTFAILWGMK